VEAGFVFDDRLGECGLVGEDGDEVPLWGKAELDIDVCKAKIGIKQEDATAACGQGVGER
jgi:hypothetical protein